MRTLNALAWRNLIQYPLRAVLSALAVALGVAMTVAADVTGGAIMNALAGSEDAQSFMSGLMEQLGSTLTLVGVGITLAAGFLLFNAFAMSITQRRRQIGMMRSLGMTRGQVMRLLLVEALFTGLLGALLGLVAGPLLARASIALMERTMGEGLFVFAPGPPSPSAMLLASALGTGITLASVLLPAWGATRIPPLAALREPEAARMARDHQGRGVGGALGAAALALYLVAAPPGEWVKPPWDTVVTGLLALLWLGCLALLLPAVIGWMGRWLRGPLTRLAETTGRLVADNLRRGRLRVTVTVLTLAVALTMIMGMTGLIRFAFGELMLPKIEQTARLGAWVVTTADLMAGMSAYVHLEDLEIPPEVVAQIREALQDRARIMEWHFVIVPELSFFGSSYFSFVMEPQAAREGGDWVMTFTEGDWETAMPILEAGCGVLMMPLVASNNGVSLGDTLEVTGVDGPVPCTVAGIGSTYVGASIISAEAGSSFGTTAPISLLVWPLPGVNRDAFAADFTRLIEGLPRAEARELGDLSDAQFRVMDALPNTLNALLVLAILAAALGVVNTTMMSVAERRRELGLLRAVGATRRQVGGVVAGEAALMGLVGGGLGLVAGAGIVVLLAVAYGGNGWGVRDLDLWAAAWRSVQPALLTGLVGLVAAPFVCAGAAWLPARSFLREPVIEAIEAER